MALGRAVTDVDEMAATLSTGSSDVIILTLTSLASTGTPLLAQNGSSHTSSVGVQTLFAAVGATGLIVNTFILTVILLQQRKKKWHVVDRLMTSQLTMDALIAACNIANRVALFSKFSII